MTDIKTASERYRLAHEARQQWTVQLAKLNAEHERLQSEIPKLEHLATDSDAAKSRALTGYVSGTNGQPEVSQARKTAAAALDRVTGARELLEAVSIGIGAHHERYSSIVHEQEAAREAFCFAVSAPIEENIRTDKKLRRQLIDAFAAICSVRGDGLNVSTTAVWDGLLTDIFSSPIQLVDGVPQTSSELLEAIERFDREHLKPIIGTTENA